MLKNHFGHNAQKQPAKENKMLKRQVTATVPARKDKDGKDIPQIGPFTITIDDGETAKEQIEVFGDEAVKSNASSNWDVTIQSAMRTGMKKGETQEQLQARLGNVKMGVKVTGVKVDPVQAYLAQFASATPEKQKEMLADLQKRAVKK